MYVCFSRTACQEACRSPGLAENFPPLAGRFVANVLTELLDLSTDLHLMTIWANITSKLRYSSAPVHLVV